ncbi:MAG: hypothetical protein RIS20_2283 [Bacteroidota bacterium]|jgi:hypothetical protein
MKYKSPLNTYVLWHPKFKDGQEYAKNIYNLLCRDSSNPLSRGIGIPVFYRSSYPENEIYPIQINFDEAKRNAIIVLVSDEMFNDPSWGVYISNLHSNLSATTRIYPVALSSYAYYQNEGQLNKNQFIQLNKLKNFNEKWETLKHSLLHDLSRLMIDVEASHEKPTEFIPPPIKIFLSHAKLDGLNLAVDFKNFIQNNSKLNTFFDAHDIADGYDFEQQIKNNLKNSAVIVFHTDEYSNREWCRIEVIVAKRNKSPLVIVHDIKKGEKRSFPYMGNVPTVKWNNQFEEIIDMTLIQVLNNSFSREKIENDVKLFELNKSHSVSILSSPPELFNFIDLEILKEKDGKKKIVVYPDPPLGIEELNVLNEFDENLQFLTPIMLSKLV